MTIWEVIDNDDYRDFCLMNSNHPYITDSSTYFKEKQEDTSFVRTIRTLKKDDNNPLADIMNYCSISGTFLVNQKAKKVLQENFEGIQFFETICAEYPEEKFFLLNVFNYQDVLDMSRSEYKSGKNRYGKFAVGYITSYVFQEKAFELDMFKIIVNGQKRTNHLFVTDKFKCIIEENHLTGLNLRKVYEI